MTLPDTNNENLTASVQVQASSGSAAVGGDVTGGVHIRNEGGAETDIEGSTVHGPVFSGAFSEGAQIIVKYALSAADQAQEQQNFEQEKLARAVAQRVKTLEAKAQTPLPPGGNPYRALDPYQLADTTRFFGRKAATTALCQKLLAPSGQLLVLQGEARVGKTSVLRAGLVPALIAAQHLPLVVSFNPANAAVPVATLIKQTLLPDLTATPKLAQASLKDFIQQTLTYLPNGKQLFILLDQFELLFEKEPPTRVALLNQLIEAANALRKVTPPLQQFVNELKSCLNDDSLACHWLISVRTPFYSHLLTALELPLLGKEFTLAPLTRAEAQAAIEEPARRQQLAYEAGVVEALLTDLGGEPIAPAPLQVVCHTLVERLAPDQKQLTLAAYTQVGRASGILRSFFDKVLPPAHEVAAWQVLAVLHRHPRLTPKALLAELQTVYALPTAKARKALRVLEASFLVQLAGEHYALANPALSARIQTWEAEQATFSKARQEMRRQWAQMQNSPLRGVAGGALGFVLAFLVAYPYPSPDALPLQAVVFIALLRALPGALLGLATVFGVDLVGTSFTGPRRRLGWLVQGGAMAVAFALGLLLHAYFRPAFTFVWVALEGAVWGLCVGLGALWTLRQWPIWWRAWLGVSVTSVVSGVALWVADHWGHAFYLGAGSATPPPPALTVALAGALLPLCLLTNALLGQKKQGE